MRVLCKYLHSTKFPITDAHTAATVGAANQNLWFMKLCPLNIWCYTVYWGFHILVLIFSPQPGCNYSIDVTSDEESAIDHSLPRSRLVEVGSVHHYLTYLCTCVSLYSLIAWVPQYHRNFNGTIFFCSEKSLKSSEMTHMDPCGNLPCFCVAYSMCTFDDL